jgi:hypothetical protein
MNALGGHVARKKNRADHKSAGFVPTPKPALVPAQSHVVPAQENSAPVQNTSAPAQEEKQETKKGKKLIASGKATPSFDQAVFLVVTPKEFKTQSSLIWQAQKVAENRWNWPKIDYRLGRRPNPSGSRRSRIGRHSAGDPTPS